MNIKVGFGHCFLVANLVACGNKSPQAELALLMIMRPLPGFSVTLEGKVDAGAIRPNTDVILEVGDLIFKTKLALMAAMFRS